MRLAFIGTGWVTGKHLDAIAGVPGLDLVAIAGRDLAKAEALARPRGAAAFADWRAMLASARPDAVYICLAPHAAAEAALGCAGKVGAVMVEKPVASTLEAAQAAERAFAASATLAAAAYHNRARAMAGRIRALCAEQEPVIADAWWHGDMPPPLWWRTRSQSGGQMTEQCTHLVDLLRLWLGEATTVTATAVQGTMRREVAGFDVDDAVAATIRFAGGAIATVHTSCIAKPGQGSDGIGLTLRARGWEARFSGWDLAGRIRHAGGSEELLPAEADIFRLQAERFRDAVEKRDASLLPCSFSEAVATLRLTRAIDAAAVNGHVCQL